MKTPMTIKIKKNENNLIWEIDSLNIFDLSISYPKIFEIFLTT